MTQDEDQLQLLSIFHYVVGGLAGFFALIPIIHLTLGLILIFSPNAFESSSPPPPPFVGWIIVFFAAAIITFGWIFAGAIIAAGRFLARRKHRKFCVAMAGVECIFMPFGTVLGAFTIIVLMRESVKQLFAEQESLPAPAAVPT